MTAPAVKAFPLNYFGIAFGLTGLAGTWTAASDALEINRVAANVLWLVALAVWLVSLARYLRGARTPKQVLADLEHPVLGPFASLVPTTGMLYGAALSHYAPTAGRVVVLVMFVLGLAVATLFFTRLMVRQRDIDQLHAGYLLPTVAAGLIGGRTLATVRTAGARLRVVRRGHPDVAAARRRSARSPGLPQRLPRWSRRWPSSRRRLLLAGTPGSLSTAGSLTCSSTRCSAPWCC